MISPEGLRVARARMTRQPPFVLGIDGGTNAIKAGLYDLQGHRLAFGASAYATTFPRPGWAEQDPDDWWHGLVAATRACLAQARVPPEEVIGLSADATTCTLLLLDARGRHLGPALLWMDVRAAEQAQQIFATGDPALRYSLAGCSAEWMPPKMLWLKQHQPERYRAAHTVVEYADWLGYQLTGKLALNINTVTQRWFYDRSAGGWPLSFYEAIGLGDLHAKLPADVLPLGEVLGSLRPEVATALGLPAGIPVAINGGDAFISLLGLGAVHPGDLGLITGASNVLAGLSTDRFHRAGLWGLSLQTGRGHVYRALMEGIAYGTRAMLDTFTANRYPVQRIVASGGATRSPLFMHIYADVTGVPIVLTDEPEATLLSSAILAAYGAGTFASLPAASAQMARPFTSFAPDPERHQRYNAFYQFYTETYPQLRSLMHRMSSVVASQDQEAHY